MGAASSKSIRERTLSYISVSLLFTVFAICGFAAFSSWKSLREQMERNLLNDVEKSSLEVNRIIDSHRQMLVQVVGELADLKPEIREAKLAKLISQHSSNVVALTLILKDSAEKPAIELFAANDQGSDARFEDRSIDSVRQKIKKRNQKSIRLGKNNDRTETSTFLENLLFDKEIRLPLVNIEFKSTNRSDLKNYVGIITVWQSEFTQALGRNKEYQGFLAGRNGELVATEYTLNSNSGSNISDLPIFNFAKKVGAKTASYFDYQDSKNNNYSGAFYRLPQWNDMIVIDQISVGSLQRQLLMLLGQNLAIGLLLTSLFVFAASSASKTVAADVRGLAHVIKRIGSGDFAHTPQQGRKDEFGLLGAALNQMSVQIQMLLKAATDRARSEKAMGAVSAAQGPLTPEEDTERNFISISGFYQPALECGGDLWGNFALSDGVELVYICDAMDRGSAATTTATVAYASFKMIGSLLKSKALASKTPSSILSQINNFLYATGEGKMCLTCFLAVFDTNTGVLTYSNAGHNFPILLPAREADPRGKQRRNKALQKTSKISPINLVLQGMPLGIADDSKFIDKSIKISAGDKVIFFTDGLIDGMSAAKKRLGRKALVLHLLRHANQEYRNFKEKVLEKTFRFYGSVPLKDDIALVVAEISNLWPGPHTPAKDIVEKQADPLSNLDIENENSKEAGFNEGPVLVAPKPVPAIQGLLPKLPIASPMGRTIAEQNSMALDKNDGVSRTAPAKGIEKNFSKSRAKDLEEVMSNTLAKSESLRIETPAGAFIKDQSLIVNSSTESAKNSAPSPSSNIRGGSESIPSDPMKIQDKLPAPYTSIESTSVSKVPNLNIQETSPTLGSVSDDNGNRRMPPPGILSTTGLKVTPAPQTTPDSTSETISGDSAESAISDETVPQPIERLSTRK